MTDILRKWGPCHRIAAKVLRYATGQIQLAACSFAVRHCRLVDPIEFTFMAASIVESYYSHQPEGRSAMDPGLVLLLRRVQIAISACCSQHDYKT